MNNLVQCTVHVVYFLLMYSSSARKCTIAVLTILQYYLSLYEGLVTLLTCCIMYHYCYFSGQEMVPHPLVAETCLLQGTCHLPGICHLPVEVHLGDPL